MEKETVYQTECMKAVVGIPPQLLTDYMIEDLAVDKILIKCVKVVEERTGIYLSIETKDTWVHYKKEWGCPSEIGGEDCICIEILRNPKFNTDPVKWKDACLELMRELKASLNQSTISVQFFNIEMHYLFTENE